MVTFALCCSNTTHVPFRNNWLEAVKIFIVVELLENSPAINLLMSHNLSGLFDHIERDHQCALKNTKKSAIMGNCY